MEFSEVNLKLSKYFELKIRLRSLPMAVSDSIGFNAPCALVRDEDKIFLSVFLPKTYDYTKFTPFFPLLGVEERELYFMVKKKISDERVLSFLMKLDNIDGLAVPYMKIEGKYLILTGYMLESSTMAFSDLISEYISVNGILAKISIKPSMGIFDYMKSWCVNLKSIVISLPMSIFGHYRLITALKDTGAIAQFIDNYSLEGQFRTIIYSDKNLEGFENMLKISEDEHIYTTKTDEDILNLLANKAMKKNITWNFLFMYADENKFYMNFVLPDFRAREYFNLIVDTEMDLKHLDWVTLEYFGDVVNSDLGRAVVKQANQEN